MDKKHIINGKEVEAPGKFILSITPEERLKELQKLYNSQECEKYTSTWVLKMKAWREEIQEIIELYPELAPIKLKTYTHC